MPSAIHNASPTTALHGTGEPVLAVNDPAIATANQNGPVAPAPYQPVTAGIFPQQHHNDPAPTYNMPPTPNTTDAPPHTQTQSTLAPTSEYVRYLLLGLPARYILRSNIEGMYSPEVTQYFSKLRQNILKPFVNPKLTGEAHKQAMERAQGVTYDYALGLGSLFLTYSYTSLVFKDIKNLFCETVGMELGKPASEVTFRDISQSDNKIIKRTMDNFWHKAFERFGTDLLFFVRPLLHKFHAPWVPPVGDLMIGVKAAQALGDTWKRKTTMFEDLVTFVNNKINPRNGLGQPISVGEIFDLYQHYAEGYHPEKMFRNVLTHDGAEIERWAKSQPIFQRITELMNQTYAYKHTIAGHDYAPHANAADLPLPKFIYLLGHELIDADQPERTLTAIEVINRHGVNGVKAMETMQAQGTSLEAIRQQFGVQLPMAHTTVDKENDKNGVIAKGSTMQLDAAPDSKIDASSIRGHELTSRAPDYVPNI